MRYILWTGGIDSTFLLCKCARESDEPIQPLYILFGKPCSRSKSVREIEAQNRLLPVIRGKEGVIAEIKDPIRFEETELPQSTEFENAYKKIEKDSFLREHFMYRGLGRLSLKYPDVMIGIEAPAPNTRIIGRTETFLNSHGLTINKMGNVIFTENGDQDVFTVFGRLKFRIIRINAAEELATLEKWGYSDLLPLCRTCTANLEYQCGVCPCCETKMKYGDTFKPLMERGYINHKIKEYLLKLDNNEGTDYGRYYTLFVWGGESMSCGYFEIRGESIWIDRKTSENLTQWFNALRKAYPNFDKVDKTLYGL